MKFLSHLHKVKLFDKMQSEMQLRLPLISINNKYIFKYILRGFMLHYFDFDTTEPSECFAHNQIMSE